MSPTVIDSVEDVHTLGLFNGQPAVIVIVTRQPEANIIATVDAVEGDTAAAARKPARRRESGRRIGPHALHPRVPA